MTKYAALILFLASASAYAQYDGPALEACRAYAKRELAPAAISADDFQLACMVGLTRRRTLEAQ